MPHILNKVKSWITEDKGERIPINSLRIWKKDWPMPWWRMLQRCYDIRDLALSKFYTSL